MLKSEAGRQIIHCDRCNARLQGEALPEGHVRQLAERARQQRWRVERHAGDWHHICPSHPAEKQGKLL